MVSQTFELIRRIGEDGELIGDKILELSNGELRELYSKMLIARLFDERAFRLQRQGRIGTYPPYSGQEASQIGSTFLLEKGDWLFPYGRDLAACFTFGKDMKSALLYAMGHKDGSKVPQDLNIFPLAIMIPPQIPQAVGAAWASKLKNEDRVALTTFGDGATSKGDFHEGLNMAAVLEAPVVFFCQNNKWAISVPIEKQMATETIAQKAIAYGMKGVRVDGNDVLAVYDVTKEAIIRARNGEGPTLIEAVTYRVGPHTTSDDPTRYREESTAEEWRTTRDPIQLFKNFLIKRGIWSEQEEVQVVEDMKNEINIAIREAEATTKTTISDIFDHVYETPTADLVMQKREVETNILVKP
ncbi:pyruvate dehydrogenase (acetyl-transferring) E1 component subunit alpha [Cytobacillus depressus]|uniref:Pyruvate dehydrogenase E1 component subunit alpha n=1 Tax=Cytobacillus depressus TaxID=1602942 RepID=A0A6L3V5H4_9BACI|nr:pyruvate dehydrogenase (acetyl-transferring) E1 component subunit alpha [Cytobacillus depressus]KAB2330474.1 pyruvate dehydrogenase (acetyl-transferring) E1 component subunit alpha [Cytobacillus depressus]